MIVSELNRNIWTSQKEALVKTDQDYSNDNGVRNHVYDITGRSIFRQSFNSTFFVVLENLNMIIDNMNDLCSDCMIELNEWYNKPKTGNF